MDLIWTMLSGIFILAGIIGCLLPLVPGPPLSFVGLLLLQLKEEAPFATSFLIGWAIVVVTIAALDYVVPLYGTKKWGGTKFGLWGCTVGLIAGFWAGPIGIIAGPFFGALIGEWIGNRNSHQAMRAALGSFFGFLLGTVLKLITSGMFTYYYIVNIL